MSHEIDMSNSRANIAYVGETPWHNLGFKLDENASPDDWRKAAGLDWEAHSAPVQYVNGAVHDYPERRVLYRSDTGAPLSIVTPSYRTVQPADVIDFFRQLTLAGGFKLETAGVLSGGKRIWALARVNDGAPVIGQDTVRPYLLLATSFDGTMATIAKFEAIRVVCNNTISMAIPQAQATSVVDETDAEQAEAIVPAAMQNRAVVSSVRIPHSTEFKPEEVRRKLGIVLTAWDRFLVESRLLADTPVSTVQAETLTAELLLPLMTVDQLSGTVKDVRFTRGAKRIMSLFEGEAKGADMAGRSAWGWLNAVTQYVDWERGRSQDTRLTNAWFGLGDKIKSRAMELAGEVA